ncbi:zinc finger protein jing isoform X1 [Vanessa atalanta]|uniref:zinc finger protein jing isoform X1 n=2 Tax=Vanessa atalanta TaxID=42275 RepID=UPI001FCD0E9B|nr:zinc finger protein jing isoform X1 [Vanessa atalanta]
MADGSPEDRAGPFQMNNLTFSAANPSHSDTKQCSGQTLEGGRLKLSFYTELDTSESCENSETRGVVADRSVATVTRDSRKTPGSNIDDGDDRKRRCFDRYDSSESSDSGVAVLSPTESSGCSGSDITEPRSPRSPESACSTSEESAGARMPPWASDPAPPGPRRLAAQPAPLRRPNPPIHRRITEYFNHKMKPQNGVKRDSNSINNNDTKKKCLPKNGVTHDLEKYISYLSQTLSPKVLLDETQRKPISQTTANCSKNDFLKTSSNMHVNGIKESIRAKETHKMNGFMEARHGMEAFNKERNSGSFFNADSKKHKTTQGPTVNVMANMNKAKVAIPASSDIVGLRIAPATSMNQSPKKQTVKPDSTKLNGIVSSTTKLDSRMNGVTCGSNNLNLVNKTSTKKEPLRKNTQTSKRTNRKSSACIANSKNLTWSKANNLKHVQLQKQNCTNLLQNSPVKNVPGEANTAPKMNVPNGVRQVSMTVNGSLGNLNVPVANLQNCHQINIPQPCNGTVQSPNLASFVAVPQNVMLTTLRIPQNGLPSQTLNQQGNIATFNRTNVNVTSPNKLNGQYVFPLVQNINGTVVQIPNIMAKMPNFVLPQNPQITTQRPDQHHQHLTNQQAAQILINGTLLKLANTIPPTYTTANKSGPATSQSIPVMNKNVTGLQAVGMTVQPKQNFTVNLSHSVLVPQPGFIVTSVPNMNVKETWSYTSTNSAPSQTSSSNPIVHHPSLVTNYTAQTLHSSSIPIAPVKPPDNPIQGTEPPSSTVKESEISELTNQKCDIPWLSKTVNNNIFPLDSNKISSRPFAQVSSCSANLEELATVSKVEKRIDILNNASKEDMVEELRKVEAVARREETLFTQITVLKDVSSNVQNTLLEANFCSATTESSESGIGTDKSVASPSDSQTSKECDDDSSLSLSVSVSSVEATSSQKSPILKQPKILRFPPRSLIKPESNKRKSSTDTTNTTVCLWENCKMELESDTDLLEHLQSVHVESQAGRENYVCLWEQCKVRGKPSCSRLWLERHTLSHGGNKPFKCIVDGCDRRFSTQILLERHVNNHFNETSPNTGSGKKATDSSSKLIRRNGKKLRYRRQPWSARMFDFFDAGMMEGLAWRLSRSTRWRLGGACPLREPAGRHTLTLHAALAATRYNAAEARREALVTYYPPHVLEDEWVPEHEVQRVKRVEISSLPAHTKVQLYEQFCRSYRAAPSPPPARRAPAAPVRLLPARHCTSARLLSNLIAKQRRERSDCSATNLPMRLDDDERAARAPSGARKRKLGRPYGANAFSPCGR